MHINYTYIYLRVLSRQVPPPRPDLVNNLFYQLIIGHHHLMEIIFLNAHYLVFDSWGLNCRETVHTCCFWLMTAIIEWIIVRWGSNFSKLRPVHSLHFVGVVSHVIDRDYVIDAKR